MGGTYSYQILLNIRLEIQGKFQSNKGSSMIYVQTPKKNPAIQNDVDIIISN